MTSITIRPDDSGIQSLKKDNNATSTAREVGQLSPTNRTQPAQEYPPTPPQAQTQATYRGPNRRKGERRQTKDQVILDTRDKRERRRQAQDVDATEDAPKIGIDVFG
ncbi:MAG: hypothetical protein KKA36_06845 [Gammaproteobacteria bacterium]|nr:hypothetical protein [Gammaproteobacteria bacterium]MBU2478792.1 hypothetical protein [Gammaproteobacteria bacterium]